MFSHPVAVGSAWFLLLRKLLGGARSFVPPCSESHQCPGRWVPQRRVGEDHFNHCFLSLIHVWLNSVKVTAPAPDVCYLCLPEPETRHPTVNGQKNFDLIMLCFLNFEHVEGRASISTAATSQFLARIAHWASLWSRKPTVTGKEVSPFLLSTKGWLDPDSHFSSFSGCSIRRH